MSTKTYRGSSLEECFTKVKSDMGGNAIILTSRAFQPIFGRFGKTTHEVTATLDETIAAQSRPRPSASTPPAATGRAPRGVYGYSSGDDHGSAAGLSPSRIGRGGEARAGVGSPGNGQSKLRMVDLGPPRAIEIAEARTAELRGIERRAIEVRGIEEGRRIELRGEDNDAPRPVTRELSRPPSLSGEVSRPRDGGAPGRKGTTKWEGGSGDKTKEPRDERIERLEAQILTLSTSLKVLSDAVGPRGKAAKSGISPLRFREGPGEGSDQPQQSYALLRKRLIDSGVVEPLVRRMVDELDEGLSEAVAIEELRTAIARRLVLAGTLEPVAGKTRCVDIIGPTGVGKTTTLAKLAAHLTLVDQCKVGVVSMDTQRVAASRQVETFGEILRIPVKIAYDGDELAQQYEDFVSQGFDYVLVDTPGKSPNDAIAIGEVARSLKGMPMLTKYLVVPATLSGANHDYVTGKFFSLAAPDAVILTKCDESADSSHLAHLLTSQAKFNVPIAYIASGPRIPDDIAPADAHAIAEKLLG